MGLLRPNRGSKQTIFNFNRKKVPLNLVVQTKPLTFALANKQKRQLSFVRRDGRVVEYTGLENRRTARYRGFESLSLRKVSVTCCFTTRYADFSLYTSDELRTILDNMSDEHL